MGGKPKQRLQTNRPSSPKGGARKPIAAKKAKPPPPPQKTQQQTKETTDLDRESLEDVKRQQTLLNIFSTTFSDVLGADDFAAQVQEVKGALFNRDFEAAFAREAALDVYAARWSPTRALCYARILRELEGHLQGLVGGADTDTNTSAACENVDVDDRKEGERRGRSQRERGEDEEAVNDEQDGGDIQEGIQDLKLGEPEENGVSTAAVADQAPVDATEDKQEIEKERKSQPLKILSIGGAAAEIVAFADFISHQSATSATSNTATDITLLDIGPWESVVSRLHTSLISVPPIWKYASAAAKAANAPLIPTPSSFQCQFVQKDILQIPQAELFTHITAPGGDHNNNNNKTPVLITLLFTLNELYTAGGIKRTTAFLRSLTSPGSALAPGSLLLVVDSPGSYSEAAVGKAKEAGEGDGETKKKYPMQWLLEHTLTPPPPRKKPVQAGAEEGKTDEPETGEPGKDDKDGTEEGGGMKWEKVESHDSVWFRVADGLRYPIPLENMRYQMHMYRAYID
ncbi:hypothetical protein F4808DRAFT_9739 [Astrocystis sublimbata]|nr:hypothetical protein F4808DRAFT_9739 [Astrocystis sublimbata]